MSISENNYISFINDVSDADIWILPETEKNLKTTVWGTATVSGTLKGESCRASLCEPGDGGLYLFRMIDRDGFYHSADGIVLKNGWALKISGDDIQSVSIEVSDENGATDNIYTVFSARL